MKQSSRNRVLLSRSADFLYSIDGNPLAAVAAATEKVHLDPEVAGHRDHPRSRSHRDAMRCGIVLAKSLIPTDGRLVTVAKEKDDFVDKRYW